MTGRTPEEMAWSNFVADNMENAEMVRKFVTMTRTPYPLAPEEPCGIDDERFWEWAEKLRRWMRAYCAWLTTIYGWERAPRRLVEEFTSERR